MTTKTADERIAIADTALETAISTLLAADDRFDRVGALKLLTRRMVRKNTTNRTRPRAANE